MKIFPTNGDLKRVYVPVPEGMMVVLYKVKNGNIVHAKIKIDGSANRRVLATRMESLFPGCE